MNFKKINPSQSSNANLNSHREPKPKFLKLTSIPHLQKPSIQRLNLTQRTEPISSRQSGIGLHGSQCHNFCSLDFEELQKTERQELVIDEGEEYDFESESPTFVYLEQKFKQEEPLRVKKYSESLHRLPPLTPINKLILKPKGILLLSSSNSKDELKGGYQSTQLSSSTSRSFYL